MSRPRILLCAAALAVAGACADDEQISPRPDAAADPGSPDAADPPDAAPTSTVFAVAGDFAGTGVASTIVLPSLDVTTNAIAAVASDDPVVRSFGDRVYIINRFNHDNITIVDPSGPTLVDQISTGAGSNPQDVAVDGDTLYVAALGAGGVLVLDASDPSGGVQSTIDLSSLDSVDNLPDCGSLYLVGDTLFVACSVLDESFAPRGSGKVAVIDTTNDTLTTTLDLSTQNPFGFFALAGEELLIATVPSFVDLTQGCVEAIDTSGAPSATGCKIQHTATGGFVNGMSYDGTSGTLYLAVTETFGTDGALFSYAGGTLSSGSIVGDSQVPGGVAVCPTGHVVYAEGGGYRVLDASATEITTAPLDIGLPPVTNGVTCF